MDFKTTDELQENIFGFEDADKLGCTVKSYTWSHHDLVIEINQTEKRTIQILFTATQYFSGITAWNGANVRLHTKQACIALLEKQKPQLVALFQNGGLMDDFAFYLFSISTREGNTIQIIAGNAALINAESF
jgi:hypothetical protein